MPITIRDAARLFAIGAMLAAALATGADTAIRAEIEAATSAATRFLATLDTTQSAAVVLPPDSPLKANWSNLPAGMLRFERNGIRVGDLSAPQRAALFDFLAAASSGHGYHLVAGVLAAENALADGPRASRLGWSADNYWLAFFGEPAESQNWSWQFGGHHLALYVALRPGAISMSPTFIGIEPATIAVDGAELTPLADHLSGGVALMAALPDAQRAAAVVRNRPRDLYAGAGADGVIPPLEGSRVADWPAAQQRQLLELVGLWVSVMPPAAAARRLAEIEADLTRLRFAWNGPLDASGSIYYRIQGPTLIVEFATRGGVGTNAGHYHSIYRNPGNEYGGD